MALFVDTSGFPLEAELDIIAGVGVDGGNVSDTPVPGDTSAVRIVYTPTTSGFGQDRLDALVNTLPNFIVITGVNSSFLIGGVPISNMAGVTFVDGTIIRVIYDVTQCAGSNYFVFDSSNNQISFPNFVLLGHEMAHAFHLAIGDSPPPGAAAEAQAITDENGYRSQNSLTLRDPNNHAGGCGLSGGGGGGGGGVSCLIATAAYGSAEAPQLNNVRRLRDVLLLRSAWGAEFFGNLHKEYYRFSPRVADQMNRSPAVSEALFVLTVEPFFEFLGILDGYVRLGNEDARTVETRLQRFAAKLPRAGVERKHASRISAAFSNLKARLRLGISDKGDEDLSFAPEEGAGAMSILGSLSAIIEATVPAGGYVAWALLDPLVLFWKAVSQAGPSGSQFLREIDDWLRSTPMQTCYAALDEQTVEQDLDYLRQILFTSSEVRKSIGKRLLRNLDGRISYDLRALLQRTGYGIAQ